MSAGFALWKEALEAGRRVVRATGKAEGVKAERLAEIEELFAAA